MKKTAIVLCVVWALTGAATVDAQRGQGTVTQPAPRGPRAVTRSLKSVPLETQLVKGLPYSAEVVTESIQTLGDGNRIVQRKTGRVYRDGLGRIRREDDGPAGVVTISLTDPVAGTAFTLDPAKRTAHETPGGLSLGFFRFSPPSTSSSVFSAWKPAEGVIQGPRGSLFLAPGFQTGYGYTWDYRVRDDVGEVSEEKLPDRTIEGVLATGFRRTTTIAKGAIGNEQPIKIVSEEWTSPDLQLLVLTDHLDPRTGRSTYRLLKISRLEPDPALFQVPADYTVERLRGRGGRGGGQ